MVLGLLARGGIGLAFNRGKSRGGYKEQGGEALTGLLAPYASETLGADYISAERGGEDATEFFH